MSFIRVAYEVPYICQYASRKMVDQFVYGMRAVRADPAWMDYGARTREEYAHWAQRACGIVCVMMAAEGLTGKPAGRVMRWVEAGLALNGYVSRQRKDRPGERVELGWRHEALAELARQRGLQAQRREGLTLDDLSAQVQADRVVIASVTSELGERGAITRDSGHLVVVFGVEVDDADRVQAVLIHNPSGRIPPLQDNALIPTDRFRQAFSGRGIIIGQKRQRTDTVPRQGQK